MQILLPRWLDDEIDGREWAYIGLGALALAMLAALAWIAVAGVPPRAPHMAVVVLQPPRQLHEAAGNESLAVAPESEQTVLPSCAHQALDLSWSDKPERACVAATRVVQDGGVRRYVFAPEVVSGSGLRIDTAGGQVFGVALSTASGATFTCSDDDCDGFTIGAPDRHGTRLITVRDAMLQSADAPVRLNASLAIAPDRLDAATACTVTSLTIVESTGALGELCPNAGAGFALAGDGRRSFGFDDNEGRHLGITLAPDGAIEQITLQGLSCSGAACGGLTLPAMGGGEMPGVGRTFTFSGTVLSADAPVRRTAMLTGSVTMPAQ